MKALILSQKPFFRARAGVAAALLVVTTSAALAQSISTTASDIQYSFTLDPASALFASNLNVNDNGLIQYNLIDSTSGPYTSFTGSGSAAAAVDPVTNYNNGTWSGESKISSSATTGAVGTASASVGSQEALLLSNTGTNTISLDVSALAHVSAAVSATGPATASNFAQVGTYAGIYDYDITTSSAISNPLVHLTGASDTGTNTSLTGGWTSSLVGGQTTYSDSYILNLAPGETHILEFYASGKTLAGAAPTPEPASLLPLLIGLVGIAGFRKRSLAAGRI